MHIPQKASFFLLQAKDDQISSVKKTAAKHNIHVNCGKMCFVLWKKEKHLSKSPWERDMSSNEKVI